MGERIGERIGIGSLRSHGAGASSIGGFWNPSEGEELEALKCNNLYLYIQEILREASCRYKQQ